MNEYESSVFDSMAERKTIEGNRDLLVSCPFGRIKLMTVSH